MHQTFYIDIDEEISSMVDRLSKSMSLDNYFVIPKRAIMLQSAVNLKLLKREADKLGKIVYVVTADETGAALAKRSGIEVLKSLEGIEAEENSLAMDNDIFDSNGAQEDIFMEPEEKALSHLKNTRLVSVGSSDYYGESMEKLPPVKVSASRATKKTLQPSHRQPIQRAVPRQGMDMRGARKNTDFGAMKFEETRERKIEKMFAPALESEKEIPQTRAKESSIGNGLASKIFFGLVIFSVVLLAGVASYLFVPSAVVTVEPNSQITKADLSVHAGENVQIADLTMPLKVIDKNETITLQYDASGKSQGLGQKARGSVVISNSFSAEAQVLVATTRLQAENGKIFRLSKGVTVPGMNTVAGQVQPGAIEADVVADEAGGDYNIDSTTFTIPGFKGSPKFEKFSAKATSPITGGTLTGDAGGQTVVSEQDINTAKTKTEEALRQKIADQIKNSASPGDMVLVDGQKITINKSTPSAKVGDAAGNFDYTVEAVARALVFSENDVKALVQKSSEKGSHPSGVAGNITKIEYGPAQADFSANTLDLQIHAETVFTPKIDIEKLKQDVLGKDAAGLAEVVKKNSNIKGLNVIFNPTFITRVPQYSMRVTLEVQK